MLIKVTASESSESLLAMQFPFQTWYILGTLGIHGLVGPCRHSYVHFVNESPSRNVPALNIYGDSAMRTESLDIRHFREVQILVIEGPE